MLVDSHCHLDRLDLTPYDDDLAAAIAAARERGVNRMLCIGIDANNAQAVVDIASRFDGVSASVGIHPLDIDGSEQSWQKISALATAEEVVAIGETGLDYYYSTDTAEQQRQSFRKHLQLSGQLRKPVIVHTRDAREDTINIIREYGNTDVGGILHCFTETEQMAAQALELNYYISFSGIITFKNATELREVVKMVPLERILIETDSPYLAPMPYRGKKNEPKYVLEVAQCMADIKGVSIEHIAEITSNNYDNLLFNK